MSAGFGWRSQGILLWQQGHFQLFISCPPSLNSLHLLQRLLQSQKHQQYQETLFLFFLWSFSKQLFLFFWCLFLHCWLLPPVEISLSPNICISPGAGWQPSLLIGVPVSRFKALRTVILCSGCRVEPSGGFTNNSCLQPLWKTLWHIYRSWTCISCSPKTPLLGPH